MVIICILVMSGASFAETKGNGSISADVTSDFVWRGLKLSADDLTLIPQATLNIHPGSEVNTVYLNYQGAYGDMHNNRSGVYFTGFDLGYKRNFTKSFYAQVGYYDVSMDSFLQNNPFGDNVQEVYLQVGYDYVGKTFGFSPFLKFSRDVENYDYNYYRVGAVASMMQKFFVSYTAGHAEDTVRGTSAWFDQEINLWAKLPVSDSMYIKPMLGYVNGLNSEAEAYMRAFNGQDDTYFCSVGIGLDFK